MKQWLFRFFVLSAIVVLVTVGLAACGSDSGSDTVASDGGETTAAEGGSGGTITAAADPALLPYNYFAEGTDDQWEGINVDLAAALSEQLGEEIVFTSAPFDAIIPGLKAGRYDIALTGMFDTKERQEVINFVDYLKAKNDFLLRADDPQEIQSFEDLCGVSVGLPKGALEVQLAEEQSEACEKEGKPAVDLSVFPDLNATTLALLAGRVDVAPNDSAANAYLVKENDGKLKTTGEYLAEGYFAIGVPKDSELLDPLQEAAQALLESGELEEIYEKWGIADRTPKEITINNAAF